jgi:DNA-binding FadR family transcriptional regulator
VVAELGAQILAGRHRPGETLPREGDLAADFGVSRTSLREAVKVLSAKGLLESRPRTGVRVRPREDWNLLDPAVLSWHPDLTGDRDLMRSLIETRRVIEPPAAAMAAARATAADLARIEAACLGIEAAYPSDAEAGVEADVAFHRAVIDASGNIVLARLIGAIEAALRAVFAATSKMMDADGVAAHRVVLEHIRLRHVDGATTAMHRLIDIAAADLEPLLADTADTDQPRRINRKRK